MRVHLRKTHPNLWRAALALAVTIFGFGANFFLFDPAFDQYRLSTIMGYVFVAIGLAQGAALVTRNLDALRVTLAAIMFTTFFYGSALAAYAYTSGKTSYQLPIAYLGLCAWATFSLIEPVRTGSNGE